MVYARLGIGRVRNKFVVMRRNTIRVFILLALISIIGTMVIQIYWFKKAYETNEQEFEKSLNIALKDVAKEMLRYNNIYTLPPDPVNKITPNYYAVMVNSQLDSTVLKHYLVSAFKKFTIMQDFEYSIYDCSDQKLVYGGYVDEAGTEQISEGPVKKLPYYKADNYYFTVYFPHKASGIAGKMMIWFYSSLLILLVLIFFGYSVFVILKQKRLSEIQRDFINNMAHELRTPLSTITIAAQTLKSQEAHKNPSRILTYASIIMNEAVKLKTQAERVLSVADAGVTFRLDMEVFDLPEIIREAARRVTENATKPVKYHFSSIPDHIPVKADRMHIENMITNLVENSVKYSGEEVELTVKVRIHGKFAEITIADNGFGIAREHQKRVFDKFYRVPSGDVHNTKGFGIGLSYVALIAKAHKGSVKLNSRLHEGTVFIINLPYLSNNG